MTAFLFFPFNDPVILDLQMMKGIPFSVFFMTIIFFGEFPQILKRLFPKIFPLRISEWQKLSVQAADQKIIALVSKNGDQSGATHPRALIEGSVEDSIIICRLIS